VISVAQKEFTQFFPQPGWVEHDPNEIWSSQIEIAGDAIGRANIDLKDIAAIGITNQRETAVVWDRKTGEPIFHAIVWQDRRTAAICDQMRADGLEKLVESKTGLVIDAYFSGTKVRWMLENVPGARERAERGELAFGTIDSWLIWKLTEGEVHVTDETNASRTMLFNIHTRDWDDELLQALHVPRSMLPAAKSSSEVYGETSGGTLTGRDCRRSASCAFRPDVQQTRDGKKHLRNRLFHADEHWHKTDHIEKQVNHDHRLATRRPDILCAGRKRLHHWSGCSMVA
jgi:glycerol kinase